MPAQVCCYELPLSTGCIPVISSIIDQISLETGISLDIGETSIRAIKGMSYEIQVYETP